MQEKKKEEEDKASKMIQHWEKPDEDNPTFTEK